MRRRTLFAVRLLAVFLMVFISPVLTYASPFAYFTELNNDNIQVMGGSTPYSQGALIPVSSGCQPGGITVHPATNRAYVSCFTGGVGNGTVSVINTLSNTVDGLPITVGTGPNGIAVTADGSNIYVANYFSNTVSVFNTQTRIEGQNSPITVGTHPTGVAIGTNSQGTFAYITNYGSGGAGTVTVINTSNNQEISSGSPITVGNGPFGIALNTAGTLAYVANSLDSTVSVIDTETASVIKTITLAPPTSGVDTPEGIAVGPDGTVYVTNYDAGTVSALDAANSYAETTIDVGSASGPIGIDVNAAGTLVYVGNRRGFTMSVIDAVAKTQVTNSPFSVGAAPWSFGKFIQSTLPTLTTTSPLTNITSNAATANGNITDDGGAPVSARGVCYGSSINPIINGVGVTCTGSGSGIGSFNVSITGLTPGQTYHAQAYATNVAGTSYGGDVQFATLAIAPSVTTTAATAITSTTATGNGTVTSTGGDPITGQGICYGTSASPSTTGICIAGTLTVNAISASITGLTPGQTYHVQAYATNLIGETFGSDLTFEALSVAPSVTTTAATAITSTTATGNGTVTSTGGEPITGQGICYGTSASPSTTGICIAGTLTVNAISASITGLTPGQTYHVQAYATNEIDRTYCGADLTFVTLAAPSVTTTAATAITSTTATGNGTVTSTGGSPITAQGICYGTSASPSTTGTCIAGTLTVNAISASITGLTPGQTYHVQAYATNLIGQTFGSDLTFAALAIAPSVTTTAATAITSTTATGNGTVTSTGGSPITAQGVCYGTSASPSTTGTCIAGTLTVNAISASITGLTPGQTYHVQAYATNLIGQTFGSDLTFAALAVAPSVTTTAATAITSTTATGNGTVTSTGGSPITAQGVCYGTSASPSTTGTCIAGTLTVNAISASFTGLTPGQTYHVQAYATNLIGQTFGSDLTFVTLAAPSVTTTAATAITSTTATGNGTVTSTGGSPITGQGVCYGTSASPSTTGTCMAGTLTVNAISASITGLTPGQTYHVQAYATNLIGQTYGSDLTFTTLNTPALTTTAATAITFTTATGNGTVTSAGGSPITAQGICYGTATNPVLGGSGVTCLTALTVGVGNLSVNLSGLTPRQTYHVQAYATNSVGTSYGGDVSFTATAVWTQIPGAISSAPALAWNPVNSKIQMVAEGSGNSIWSATFGSDGTFNNDWAQVPGAIMSAPAIAWNPSASKMQMLVEGSGNSIWSATFASSGAFNTDWKLIPGAILNPPALAWNPSASKMQMLVEGSGNSIWSATFDSTGAFNDDWTHIPGSILNQPAIVWNSINSETQMAVEGGGNSIWSSTFNSTGAFNGDWVQIPGAIISSPALALDQVNNNVQILVRSSGDAIWTATFNSLGAFNNDWAQIPGNTIDLPAIVWNPVKGNFLIVVRGESNTIWSLEY